MAFVLPFNHDFHSAESGDLTCESRLPFGARVSLHATAGRKNGLYGFKHDLTAAGDAAIPGAGTANRAAISGNSHIVASGFASVDGTPTAAFALWGRKVGSTIYDHVQVGTDRKLRIYDKAGTLRGPDGLALTVPTTGTQEIVVVFDGITLSTVYVKVYDGPNEVAAFDTGISQSNFFNEASGGYFFGEPSVPAGGVGVNLYTDDDVTRQSSTAGDAVHLTAYPRLLCLGGRAQLPTAVGAVDQWSASPSVDKWLNVDDTPPHDGDTTYLDEGQKAEAQLLKSGSANPLPDPCTVDDVQLRDVGKLVVDKLGAHFMVRLAGVNAESPNANDAARTSNYAAGLWTPVTRPGGGAWVREDADPNVLEFGWMSENNPSFDTFARVTYQPGPEWIHHTATLPLGTTPESAAVADRRRGAGQVV